MRGASRIVGCWAWSQMRKAVARRALSAKLLTIQGDGDYTGAKQLTDTLGVIEADLAADLKKLEAAGIPVDIRFQQGLDVLVLVDYAQPANPASAEAPPTAN